MSGADSGAVFDLWVVGVIAAGLLAYMVGRFVWEWMQS